MKRLAITGSALWTPERNRVDLARVLRANGLRAKPSQIRGVYFRLGSIIGRWWQEEASADTEPITNALSSLVKCLQQTSFLLSGHQTGFRHRTQIEVTSELKRRLASDSEIGNVEHADAFIGSFTREATKLRQHCAEAYSDLTDSKGRPGRLPLRWYDNFTAVLLDIAGQANVKPTITTDRVTGERSGWLLQIASELETFLPRQMRSPSAEACAKRLQRSMRKLRLAKGQKPRRK